MIRILFFGKLSDLSGPLDLSLPADIRSVEALVAYLSHRDQDLAEALAVAGNLTIKNQEVVPLTAPICDGDEIAFASPLSGG